MLKKITEWGAVCSAICLFLCCASTQKSNTMPSETSAVTPVNATLAVTGIVQTPNNMPVALARVYSEPPSQTVMSKSDGTFQIINGLKENQRYRFIAEYNNRTGYIEAVVTKDDQPYLSITLESHNVVIPGSSTPGNEREVPASKGKSRPGLR